MVSDINGDSEFVVSTLRPPAAEEELWVWKERKNDQHALLYNHASVNKNNVNEIGSHIFDRVS